MAKRAPTEEKPYQPVRAALVEAVAGGAPAAPAKRVPAPLEVGEGLEPRVIHPIRKAHAPAKSRERDNADGAAEEPRERPRRSAERLDREKRVLLSKNEETELERLVQRVAAEGGTSIKLSHLLRAAITILRHSEDEVVRHVSKAQGLVRPPNDNTPALAEFEHRLAQLVAAAIRTAPPLR